LVEAQAGRLMPHADLAAEVKPEGLPKAARSQAETAGGAGRRADRRSR
jgi:hypothetical protein